MNNWFVNEDLKIERLVGRKYLPVTAIEDFESILDVVKLMKKEEKRQSIQASGSQPSTSKAGEIAPESIPTEVRRLESNQLKQSDIIKLSNATDRISYESLKPWAMEILNCFKKLVSPDEGQSSTELCEATTSHEEDSFRVKGKRKIPEMDKTFEKNKITFIEGVLPVNTRSYRLAMRTHPQKSSDSFEPTFYLNNIVKYCFPDHWLIDTTVRGQGGKKSLVSIWNYNVPGNFPCTGAFQDGLGETRLRGLLGKKKFIY